MNADFDALDQYTDSNQTKMHQIGAEIVETGLGMKDDPSLSANIAITVLDVRSGSVIIDYALSGNNADLVEMAMSNMNTSIGNTILIGNMTFNFSSHSLLIDTEDPTEAPSIVPTANPITDPSVMPSTDPTMNPSAEPTSSPTAGDVSCGDTREGAKSGEWEYFLNIINDSIVTFDTCTSYLNLFSMRIYTMNGSNDTVNSSYAECIECGSICLLQSQFRVAMDSGIYFMEIDDKHKFTMICQHK